MNIGAVSIYNGGQWNYNGGRYYSVLIYHLLNELHNVTLYTNSSYLNLIRDFNLYKQPKFESLSEIKEQDVYIGDQWDGIISAFINGAKYNKPVIGIILDSPKWILDNSFIKSKNKVDDEIKDYIHLKNRLNKYIHSVPNFKIIVLTDNSIDSHSEWFNIPKEKYISISPAINSKCLDLISDNLDRQDHIVSVNRNSYRKNWETLFELFQKVQYKFTLKIITDAIDNRANGGYDFRALAAQHRIDSTRVEFYINIPDVEKYILIKTSKALLSTSLFEGFGMWAIEGIHCNTPVICYDIPSLQDIQSSLLHKCKSNTEILYKLHNLPNISQCDIDFSIYRQINKLVEMLNDY